MADVEISSSGQKFYMRYKLRVSKYRGGRALVCGIVGGVIWFGLCWCVVLWEGSSGLGCVGVWFCGRGSSGLGCVGKFSLTHST